MGWGRPCFYDMETEVKLTVSVCMKQDVFLYHTTRRYYSSP